MDKLGRGPRLRRRAAGASSICVLGAARVRPVVRGRYDPGGRNRGAEVACICRLVKEQRQTVAFLLSEAQTQASAARSEPFALARDLRSLATVDAWF